MATIMSDNLKRIQKIEKLLQALSITKEFSPESFPGCFGSFGNPCCGLSCEKCPVRRQCEAQKELQSDTTAVSEAKLSTASSRSKE